MKLVALFIAFVALIHCGPLLAQSDIDALHYRFDIALSDESDNLSATAEITVLFRRDANRFALDLASLRPDGKGMKTLGVRSAEGGLSFDHTGDRLTVTLPAPVRAGEQRQYWVRYEGIPENGLLVGRNPLGDRTFFANNWPDRAHCWLPVVDHPSDKATCEFVITAPNHYQVVANGLCVERSNRPGGQMLTHWKESHPLPAKVMAIGVARFSTAFSSCAVCPSLTPLSTWVYPQERDVAFPKFDPVPRILNYFSRSIAPYPYEKLASVQSSNRYGGLENASAVFYKDAIVSKQPSIEGLIAHELAHQWFGDAVTETDWPHLWLSEGFATYFTALYLEHAYGVKELKREMGNARDLILSYHWKNKDNNAPVIDTLQKDPNALLNANSYQKGAWFLHMLRRRVGDDAFWKGIRAYYQAHMHRNAATSDFLAAMEQASGASLAAFFNQWLRQSGHPVLSVVWRYMPAARAVDLTITQTQRGVAFAFPIEVGVALPDGAMKTYPVEMNGRRAKARLPAEREPARLVLDPNIDLLFESTP